MAADEEPSTGSPAEDDAPAGGFGERLRLDGARSCMILMSLLAGLRADELPRLMFATSGEVMTVQSFKSGAKVASRSSRCPSTSSRIISTVAPSAF